MILYKRKTTSAGAIAAPRRAPGRWKPCRRWALPAQPCSTRRAARSSAPRDANCAAAGVPAASLQARSQVEAFEHGDPAPQADVLGQEERGADAFVIDIGLDDADGRDLCQALRAQGVRAPVLFLTALDATPDRISGFRAGGDDNRITTSANVTKITGENWFRVLDQAKG